jgi:protein-disulfide isomerase/uncharacterized membrane protein
VKAILLNRIILVLAFVGLFIAGTLSIEAATGAVVPCGPSGGGCEIVARHPSSKIAGIPVAYIGVLGYLIIGGLAILRAAQGVHRARQLVTFGYIAAALGTLASLYLQFQSFFVIRATCIWCLSSAALMIVLLITHALLAQELESNPTPPDSVAPGFGKLDLPMIAVLPVLVGVGLVTMGMTMGKGSGNGAIPVPDGENLANVVIIPDKANWFGEKTAPLTIVEFADILCPSCQQTSPQVKEFVSQNKGKVSLVFRHYPLVSIHPQAGAAAAIAEAAADQGKFWDFTLAVMAKQMKPESPEELLTVAQEAGIDTATIRQRIGNTKDVVYERIDRDLKAVKALGINSTPTFLLVANGKVIDTAGPSDILPKLNGDKAREAMNAAPAASSTTATPETKP